MNDPYASIKIKDFRYFLFSRLAIELAMQIQAVVVGWQIYEMTKDPLSLGLIGLAEAIPSLAIAPYAGHIADRVARKKIILRAITVLLFCSLSLLAVTRYIDPEHPLSVLPIYVIIFISGIARGFLWPAFFSFMAQLVPSRLYPNSSAWSSVTWQIGAVSGPAIGGLVYGFVGIQWAYTVDASLVLLSILLIGVVVSRPAPSVETVEPFRVSFWKGFHFVFKNELILSAISLDLFAVLFGGAVALLPVFAAEILHTGPEGLGILRSAPSAGAVLMALLLTHNPPHRNSGRILLASVMMFGVSILGFALSTNFYLSLVFLFLSGAFDNISVVIRSTILQTLTPDSMRGRVSAVNTMFVGSSNEIGSFESGAVAKLMGTVPSVIFGGGMTILVVIVTAILAPGLRRLHLGDIHERHLDSAR